ncbi:hypothetical protein R950_001520 [Salmonella enterica subsp. enterica]|uniref:hypothetical protein n=2 Tax=Enterobacteriaceae TaxID=543 RepID=UPI000FB60C79|nr:hypothetical protein [Salmonella enterica subsp. houtenae serovar 44:z4,z23:-]EBX5571632.1 hypothetical protein [Salmonella enterica subsp. enterica serovar Kuessel]EBZ2911439.1 hypothetical protein [Salmonella enterica subsp. enterica serovar Mesbit]ECF3153941.1 hypothetical protein [Salmonella enterica subsp. enterica serovar Volkmarsdorf]EDW1640990.1 hypothetical protein [Salmonella enterica subsp. enterica serovar Baguida]EDW2259587.1 hypothetical protein [Salmonella enterica subsp. ent
MFGNVTMLGFVSALSSAVAVMILLMSVLLTNLLSIAIEKDEKLDSSILKYSSDTEELKNKQKAIIMSGQGFSISVSDLLPLRSSSSAVRLYCTYGNNMSLKVAKKYTTYNYIVSKSVLGNKKIIVVSPIYEPTSKNNCAVEELKNE